MRRPRRRRGGWSREPVPILAVVEPALGLDRIVGPPRLSRYACLVVEPSRLGVGDARVQVLHEAGVALQLGPHEAGREALVGREPPERPVNEPPEARPPEL